MTSPVRIGGQTIRPRTVSWINTSASRGPPDVLKGYPVPIARVVPSGAKSRNRIARLFAALASKESRLSADSRTRTSPQSEPNAIRPPTPMAIPLHFV